MATVTTVALAVVEAVPLDQQDGDPVGGSLVFAVLSWLAIAVAVVLLARAGR
jgi:hypothetical protein